jgi:hypothetical protein
LAVNVSTILDLSDSQAPLACRVVRRDSTGGPAIPPTTEFFTKAAAVELALSDSLLEALGRGVDLEPLIATADAHRAAARPASDASEVSEADVEGFRALLAGGLVERLDATIPADGRGRPGDVLARAQAAAALEADARFEATRPLSATPFRA